MDIGILIVWLCLIVYSAISLKAGIIEENERKWVYALVMVTFSCTLLVLLHISLNGVLFFLNHTFGSITRMVVNI